MNKKLLGGLGIATLTTALAVAFVPTINNNLAYALNRSGNSYSCASIHFGMRDSDHTAATYDLSSGISSLDSTYYDANGVTITSYEITKDGDNPLVYGDNSYGCGVSGYSKYPIRIGKSKKMGSLTLTLDHYITGYTIYAEAFGTDPTVMVCNGQEITLTSSIPSVSQEAKAVARTYTPYFVSVASTNIITLTSKQNSKTVDGKTVSACRYFVSDIALRVTGIIPTIKYNLTLDANGGTGTKTIQVDEGNYILPDGTGFSKTGYSFVGWSETSDGSVITNVNMQADKTVYAIWEEKTSTDTTITVGIGDYASAHNWVNGTQYTTMSLDSNITATVSGGGNSGKYYTSGNQWRIYQTESGTLTITATSGYIIKTITVTYTSYNTGIFTEVASGTALTVDSNSITLHTGNSGSATNGQARVTAISVIYQLNN